MACYSFCFSHMRRKINDGDSMSMDAFRLAFSGIKTLSLSSYVPSCATSYKYWFIYECDESAFAISTWICFERK